VMAVMTTAEKERQVTEGRSIQNSRPRRGNQWHGEDEGKREGRGEEG